jgi:hypothetical protein
MAGFRIAHQPTMAPPRRRPEKRPPYLAFIHELPCAVTGRYGVQAAHVSFQNPWYGHYGRARGTKAPDLFAIPLSKPEHDRQHSMNEEAYWQALGIDPHLLGLTLWAIYSNYEGFEAVERARSRIISGLATPASLPTRDR